MLEREWRAGPSLEIAADEPIGRDLEFEGRLGGLIGDDEPVFLREREDAQDAPHAGGAFVVVDQGAHRVEMGTGVACPREERHDLGGCPGWPVGVVDAMPAARRAHVLTQEQTGRRIQQADVEIGPLHLHVLADPPRWRGVVRGRDFDTAIEMHGAHAEAVIAERFDRQRLQGWPLFGKHLGHLAFRGPVDPRVGPVRVPAIEIGLRLLERLEALAVQRRLLRVPDPRLDFAFAIRIPDAAREPDHAVVGQHLAIERIERRLVDIGRQHALFQVVEDDDPRRSAQSTKRAFMELRPGLCTRLPNQQMHGFARVGEGQDEETGAAMLAGLWMADHRPVSVVHASNTANDSRLTRSTSARAVRRPV